MTNQSVSPKIYASISKIMAEIEAIAKSKKNVQQGFMYRGIDQFYNDLQPKLSKHGVFTVPEVLDKQRTNKTSSKGTELTFVELRVKYTFFADDGSNVSCVVVGEGMDSGDKASNKAMAVAHKYALMQTFCIPTEDLVDPDSESHEISSNKQHNAPVPSRPPQETPPPEQPGYGDIVGDSMFPDDPSPSLGDFIIPIGKYANKKLKQVPLGDLVSYADYFSKVETITPQMKEIIGVIRNYLAQTAHVTK